MFQKTLAKLKTAFPGGSLRQVNGVAGLAQLGQLVTQHGDREVAILYPGSPWVRPEPEDQLRMAQAADAMELQRDEMGRLVANTNRLNTAAAQTRTTWMKGVGTAMQEQAKLIDQQNKLAQQGYKFAMTGAQQAQQTGEFTGRTARLLGAIRGVKV